MSKSQANDLEKLKLAAQKAAKSIGDIVKTVEGASELKLEAVDTVFANISHLLVTAHQRARLSLNLALAANGAADLTEKLPTLVNTGPNLNLGPAQIVPLSEPVRERMVGERKGKFASLEDADVDFIDD